MQSLVEQDAGIVAGKWTPSAVGAVHAWGKPHHQEASCRIAKRQYRPGVVIGMAVTYVGEEASEARTGGAVEK
jgi:hypothetical protein